MPPELDALSGWSSDLIGLIAEFAPKEFIAIFRARCVSGDLSSAQWLVGSCFIARPDARESYYGITNPLEHVFEAFCAACSAGRDEVATWLWQLDPLAHWHPTRSFHVFSIDDSCSGLRASIYEIHNRLAVDIAHSWGMLMYFRHNQLDCVRRHMMRKMLVSGRWTVVPYTPQHDLRAFAAGVNFIRIFDDITWPRYSSWAHTVWQKAPLTRAGR